jgi:hypothetical protein
MRMVVFAFILLSAAAPLGATVLQPMDLTLLTQNAGAVAHGHVVELESVWIDNGRKIDTLVTLDVEDYLKGAAPRQITFRIPGGQIGGYSSVVAGAPQVATGDDVVVFLDVQPGSSHSSAAATHLVGLSQGLLQVTADAAGERWVQAPETLDPQTLATRLPRRTRVRLDELAGRVRRVATGVRR